MRIVGSRVISIRMFCYLFVLPIMSRLPFILIPLALFLSACGQKGPLYIEGHEPAGLKVVKPAKPKTEPAPEVEPSAPN